MPCSASNSYYPIIDPCIPRRSVTTWKVNYLISNRLNTAAHVDPALLNPWGIAIINSQLWVVNGETDSITNYDLYGNRILAPITLRDAVNNSSHPTGIAINCCGGFPVTDGQSTKSSRFIVCGEHGTVHGCNPAISTQFAYILLNQQLTGEISVFRGIALTNNAMYLADFFQSHIDVYDNNYNRLVGYNFIDGDTTDPIPLDYGPNNIVHIGQFLYVLWARKDPNAILHTLEGPGHGFISVFNLDGSFVRRFTSRGVLNTPWGMVPAPNECGFPPGAMLVANNGDGRINVFDFCGGYIGPLLNQSGIPLHIEGIHGLAPYYTTFNEIFYTAAPNDGADGMVGSIVRDQIINF